MPTVVLGPRCNRRVTCDSDPHNDRSESALAINPLDPYNMVGSSKRFTDPHTYAFSLAAYFTFDGGQIWGEAPPLQLLNTGDVDGAGVVWTGDPWAGLSDPAVTWDDIGNAYLIGLLFGVPTQADPYHFLGMAAYKSTDGGRTWSLPTVIHRGQDDKQWTAGDTNPGSPYHGNVYAVWDDLASGQLAFARTTDHGTSWIGVAAQPAGTGINNEMVYGEINVASDGTIYIFGLGSSAIRFTVSNDGGQSFSPPAVVAAGITGVPGNLPGGRFRLETMPSGCCGSGKVIVCAWPDYRDGVARIYYNYSGDGGAHWLGSPAGDPLLTGAVASAANQHDFMPQIISTPDGEIGCAFYEFGPKGGGEFPPNLISVVLAVSTDDGGSFPNRVTVTDQPWDPTVDEVWAHGDPNVTFIGDYFGLDASRLGFFPFWTDTRTGVQEIFTARVAVNPGDLYIRDSGGDTGDVPSPDIVFWESPDIVVRRQPDGDVTFVDQDLLRDGVTHHYIYGRVRNRGPNDAAAVRLAATIGNFPSLLGLPGGEFWYPQDWYQGDWDTAPLQLNHLYLGESDPKPVANGATVILGPITWPAAQIPPPGTWHPCLLGEVRSPGDDSAGGTYGCDIVADPADFCPHGSFVIGDNNACQRNLSYANAPALSAARIDLPFIVGSVWDKRARFVELIVDKGRELAETPMTLRLEPIGLPGGISMPECEPAEIVFTGQCRVIVRVGPCEVGEIGTVQGTVWRPRCPKPGPSAPTETAFGGQKSGNVWQLLQPRATAGFPLGAGEIRKATLSFTTPRTLAAGLTTKVRVMQRKDRKIVTGGVTLQLTVFDRHDGQSEAERQIRRRRRRSPSE
jgi:hypothetical protein